MRTWEDNAAEFAALDRGDAWQFAVLVACSVEKRDTRFGRVSLDRERGLKVSTPQFADEAGCGPDRIRRYLDQWQDYAADGIVPDASTLTPGDVRTVKIPDQPWYAKDGGKYETSATNKAVASAGRVADRAARDPEYAEQVIREVTEAAPEAVAAVIEEKVAADPAAVARVNQEAARRRPAPPRHEPDRTGLSAAASLTALEAVAARLRDVTTDVVADVLDGKANPELLAEPVQSIAVDLKRLQSAAESHGSIDAALADILNGDQS